MPTITQKIEDASRCLEAEREPGRHGHAQKRAALPRRFLGSRRCPQRRMASRSSPLISHSGRTEAYLLRTQRLNRKREHKPKINSKIVAGSGTTAIPRGVVRPEISKEFIVVPSSPYSLTVPLFLLRAYRAELVITISVILLGPEIREVFIGVPSRLYSPIVPLLSAT